MIDIGGEKLNQGFYTFAKNRLSVISKMEYAKEDSGVKQSIHIEKAVESDLDSIGKLYEDICGYLETHRNYPG